MCRKKRYRRACHIQILAALSTLVNLELYQSESQPRLCRYSNTAGPQRVRAFPLPGKAFRNCKSIAALSGIHIRSLNFARALRC